MLTEQNTALTLNYRIVWKKIIEQCKNIVVNKWSIKCMFIILCLFIFIVEKLYIHLLQHLKWVKRYLDD